MLKKTRKIRAQKNGFVALISSIIISIVLLLVITNTGLTGFYGRNNALEYEYKERSAGLADACAEEAILQTSINSAYLGNETIAVGENNCTIRTIQTAGANKIIEAQGIFQNSYTNLRITIDTASLSIISWDEVANF